MLFEFIAPFITHFIVVFAIFTLCIYGLAYMQIKTAKKIAFPPGDRRFSNSYKKITDDELKKLNDNSDSASALYTLFVNLSAIFPLLGIFGTVCSLMSLSGTEDISASFSIALDTTAYGLLFAIGFKLIDSFIASELDRVCERKDYLIHEDEREKRMNYVAQAQEEHHY